MMNEVIVGIDAGSTNIKLVLFDCACNVLASETYEYRTLVPRPGWTEYEPEGWWDGVKLTIRRALVKNNVSPHQIVAIGLSSLGCCPILLDEQGNCLYNGIPWSDHRAHREIQHIIDACGEDIYEACKNYPSTLNAIPHLLWIKNNEPDVYAKAKLYLEPSAFLAYRLTGERKLDISFASSCSFGFDVRTLGWNSDLVARMGLDIEKFPQLHRNSERIGTVHAAAAAETGLVSGIPVYSGGPDFSPGALAAGILEAGQGYYSMGSGSNIIVTTDRQDVASKSLLSTIHAKGPQLRILSGVQGAIGYSFKWFRDQLGGVENLRACELNESVFDIMNGEAGQTEPGSEGVLYIPHLFGKFHPAFNTNARGMFCGISSTTTRAHLIRSVMEGCTFDMYESLRNIFELGLPIDEIVATGGPSKSPVWCQIIADVSNTRVVTVNAPEAAPFGDAILAGVGEGVFSSYEDVARRHIMRNSVYHPSAKNHALYMELYNIYLELYNQTKPALDRLSGLNL